MDRTNARGFTLTETAIVLGIIGIVLAGVWMAASSVDQKRKVQDANDIVLETSANVRSALEGRGDVVLATDVETQVQMGLFPRSVFDSEADDVFNPWGGTYRLVTTAGALYGFSVVVNMPTDLSDGNAREACVSLFTRLKPTGPAQGMAGGKPVSNNAAVIASREGQDSAPVAAYFKINGSETEVTNDTPVAAAERLSGRRCQAVSFYYPL